MAKIEEEDCLSVVNEFEATKVLVSSEQKKVWMSDSRGFGINTSFEFDFFCKAVGVVNAYFFFNAKVSKCLVVMKSPDAAGYFRCVLMKFWVESEMPVLSARWYLEQDKVISAIANEFKEKYASYLLDNIINS